MSVLSHLLDVILERRVSEGDMFLSKAAYSVENAGHNLIGAARAAPSPKYNVSGFERAYYSAQFEAALEPTGKSPFVNHNAACISLQEFLTRIVTFSTTVSNTCYVVMVLFLERVMLRCPTLFLHSGNAQRLVFASFICASKVVEDFYTSNAEFAELGGLTQQDVNALEIEFLDAMGWRTGITKEEFEHTEIEIMVEAIDTPYGKEVLALLEGENIQGLDEAVLKTQAWGYLGMQSSSQIATSTVLTCFWRCAQVRRQYFDKIAISPRAIMAGVATALLDASFPGLSVDWKRVEGRRTEQESQTIGALRAIALADHAPTPVKGLAQCMSPASIAIGDPGARSEGKMPMRHLGQYF